MSGEKTPFEQKKIFLNSKVVSKLPMHIIFRSFFSFTILVLTSVVTTPIEAQAYFDPGTGSQLLQLLLASILGALFTIKMYWKKFKGFFKNILFRKDQKKDE